ncbi:DMT family transporter [uncultured Shimia sp.]|uniref:DMT family transporter n=1 Tax=uncultured Shimia sp. TaxID=573152 RepID=UPI00261558BC|nr:DMT family transporter [uncultured Shimia sp.]
MSVTGPDAAGFDTTRRNSQVMSGNALGMASMLTWACGFPAAEFLLVSWPPLALITARFAFAVAFLMILWVMRDGLRPLASVRWGRGTVVGGLTFGLGAFLLLVAQSLTDAVTVAIIASACPVAAAIVEVANGTRRMTTAFLTGLAASVVGGIVAVGAGTVGNLGLGAIAAITSCFLFVFGSLYTVRDLRHLSEIGRSTVTLVGGLVFTSAALFASHMAGVEVLPTRVIDAQQIWLLALYAVAGMALSQVMWIASVGRLGVAVASFHINVASFYVMVIMLTVGSGWNWTKALGAAIVIAGVIVAQKPPRRKR